MVVLICAIIILLCLITILISTLISFHKIDKAWKEYEDLKCRFLNKAETNS